MSTVAPPSPMTVTCPACAARPGEPCTQPTQTGRRVVGWNHLSRRDAASDQKENA